MSINVDEIVRWLTRLPRANTAGLLIDHAQRGYDYKIIISKMHPPARILLAPARLVPIKIV